MLVCLSVVDQKTLIYPAQLATHRHPPQSPQKSDTCAHCRASIFGALRPPCSTHWTFFGDDTTWISSSFSAID